MFIWPKMYRLPFTYLLLLGGISCCGISVAETLNVSAPQLLFQSDESDGISDSSLKIRWSDASVTISGKDIVKELGIDTVYLNGTWDFRGKRVSEKSGLPLVYMSFDESDDIAIEVSAVRHEDKMIITVADMNSKKSFNREVDASASMTSTKPPIKPEFMLDKDVLVVPGVGKLHLSEVLKHGEWSRTGVVFEEFDGAIEWRCVVPERIKKLVPAKCYCSGDERDMDTPNCYGGVRTATIAFKRSSDGSGLELFGMEGDVLVPIFGLAHNSISIRLEPLR